jgi:hypothetical protein
MNNPFKTLVLVTTTLFVNAAQALLIRNDSSFEIMYKCKGGEGTILPGREEEIKEKWADLSLKGTYWSAYWHDYSNLMTEIFRGIIVRSKAGEPTSPIITIIPSGNTWDVQYPPSWRFEVGG